MTSILPNAIIADLSHWDTKNEADFETAIAKGHLVGVIVKLIQGGRIDTTAAQMLYDAYAAGIKLLGVYDFGTASNDAQQFYNDILTEFQQKTSHVLVALDAEHNPSAQMTVAGAATFAGSIKDDIGRLPTLYMGRSGPDGTGRGLPNDTLSACDLWLPAYGPHQNDLADILPPGFRMPNGDADRGGCLRLWQFTDGTHHGGAMPGLGVCDQSYAIFDSLDGLIAWWGT